MLDSPDRRELPYVPSKSVRIDSPQVHGIAMHGSKESPLLHGIGSSPLIHGSRDGIASPLIHSNGKPVSRTSSSADFIPPFTPPKPIIKLENNHRKETPNSIQVWPEGSLPPDSDVRHRRVSRPVSPTSTPVASPRRHERERETEGEREGNKAVFPQYEFWVFAAVASALWCYAVNAMLKWHKFPFHKHPGEVFLMYTVPIIVTIMLLKLLDWSVK
jgi:hypothetical protein